MADIKFTSILNLSTKPYTGGELTLFLGNEVLVDMLNTPGSLIVFPSFYYHKVSKVTSGERCTLSSWWYGPNWK
jgi:PKHD-type hydroxylase